ncbi:MAG: DUF354 domain-containing protein [Methylococcaceae bacterium]
MSSSTQHFFKHRVNTAAKTKQTMRIWIDLDNSPHVPFFSPIIEDLRRAGFEVCLTARDAYQVHEMLELHGIECPSIGRHYGRNTLMKAWGLLTRTLQLMQPVINMKPDLAVSHGSRAQCLLAKVLGIRSVVIEDYEHGVHTSRPDVLIRPECLTSQRHTQGKTRLMFYPGIKEYVYVERFEPHADFLGDYPVQENEIIVTLRTPATEAHYHNKQAEALFEAAIIRLLSRDDTKLFVLPRNSAQHTQINTRWATDIHSGRIIIPRHAISGLDLLWCSDLVIGGGGTMNREAAALGVPVLSIFTGKPGMVDQYLETQGKLKFIHTPEELSCLDTLEKRKVVKLEKGGLIATRAAIVSLLSSVVNKGLDT